MIQNYLDQHTKNAAPDFVVYCCKMCCHSSHFAQPTATKYKLTESTVRGLVKSFKEAQSKNCNTDL